MSDLPFHPLADLFPLIEGAEFDELVASIKDNGQIEPIVTLDGSILDGRNRYRACLKIGIEPITALFTGSDPILFVGAKNLARRHLTQAQKALIIAQMLEFRGRGKWQLTPVGVNTKTTVSNAAKTFGVGEQTLVRARVVLNEGTPEEIAAVKSGHSGVSEIADDIRKRRVAPKPAEEKKESTRLQTQQRHAQIWADLSGALEGLTSLPLPTDVAAVAHGQVNRRAAVAAKLSPALEWLTEFSDAWNTRNAQV